MENELRQYQYEVSRMDKLCAVSTVTKEQFTEARNWEDISYCSYCEDAFASTLSTVEGKCFRCMGYDHLKSYDISC